jgi:N-acetylneuraminic acid mutarotase
MAQLALPPGTVRRRVMFGLLDADGWGIAWIKATFWFLTIIFLIGYIPNLAYYFTVGNTIDVGYNAIPVVNFCDAGNDRAAQGDIAGRKIPCPAPPGTVIPWDQQPAELALPAGRSGALAVQSGTHLYLVGGRMASGPTADVLTTVVSSDGNFSPWTAGPALPEPRTNAALATLGGVPYIIGGLDASGAPTTTVYVGQLTNGQITGWVLSDGKNKTVDLTLPAPISDTTAIAASSGIYLIGGRTADGVTSSLWQAKFSDAKPPVLAGWKEITALPLPQSRAGASGVLLGNFLYVMGGEDPTGLATNNVYRLTLVAGQPAMAANGNPAPWATPATGQNGNLPEPRAHAASFTANGSLYMIGGTDATGAPQKTNYWTVPNATTGDIGTWTHTDSTDLPAVRTSASLSSVGSTAFVIGGQDAAGPVAGTYRAGLSPKPPFFRLGLFGATIPALSIKGEIGQQLGYVNAMTVGLINFVILVIIGLAMSHRRQTMLLVERLSRGRLRAPPEDE